MSDGDLTNYLPSWMEVGEIAYLVTEDYDDPGPGEVKIKKMGPTMMEVKSTITQTPRVLIRIDRGGESWRFILNWSGKMFNCFRLNMDFQEDRVTMSGEVMHGGKRLNGRMIMIKQDNDTTRFEFKNGLDFLNGVFWTLQQEQPEWIEEEDDDW
ncbi:MAG: hypothetical protein AAGN35_21405 [Bacteroidota bacterium]